MSTLLEPASDPLSSEAPFGEAPQATSLRPRDVLDLFFQPARFFASNLPLDRRAYLIAVMWVVGMARAVDLIERQLLRGEMAGPELGPFPWTESWPAFWVYVLASGALGGFLYWLIGGWWFRIRLQFSGAQAPDKFLARLAFAYSSFVYGAPLLLLALGKTFAFENYLAAYSSGELVSLLFLIFPLWSYYVGYRGANSNFEIDLWKGRFWFLILPSLVFVVALACIFSAFFAAAMLGG